MDDDHYSIQLMAKALAGEASAQELAELNRWRANASANEQLYNEYQAIWHNSTPPANDADTDAAWKQVSLKIKKKTSRGTWLKIAASLVLLSTIAVLTGRLLSGGQQAVYTLAGERKEITLPDGSKVWLNQRSSLLFEKAFSGSTRAVILNGEAFFEVSKDASRPFIITSANAITRVLGTSFNLIAYDSVPEVRLAVATGRVSFTSTQSKKEVIVSAGESGVINKEGDVAQLDEMNVNSMAWQSKHLVFNDVAMAEVFKALESYYNIRIIIENGKINQCHFTGDFNNPSLRGVFDAIGTTLQLTYEIKGNQVTVKGKGCE